MNTIKSASNKIITTLASITIAVNLQANPLGFDSLEYGIDPHEYEVVAQIPQEELTGNYNYSNVAENNLAEIDKSELVNSLPWVTSFQISDANNEENKLENNETKKVKGSISKKVPLINVYKDEIDKGIIDKDEQILLGDLPNNCKEDSSDQNDEITVKKAMENLLKPTQNNCAKLLVKHLGGEEVLDNKVKELGYSDTDNNENEEGEESSEDSNESTENKPEMGTTAKDMAKVTKDYMYNILVNDERTVNNEDMQNFFSADNGFTVEEAQILAAKKKLANNASFTGVYSIDDKEYVITLIMKKKDLEYYQSDSSSNSDELSKKEEAMRVAVQMMVEKIKRSHTQESL